MKNYKLIIFDLDGTLVDAYKAIELSFNYTMQKLNYPKKDALTIRRAVGWGDENLLRPFIKEKDKKKAVILYRRHHKDSLLKEAKLLPGVQKLLSALKNKGLKLAIASNRPTRFTQILLKRLNIKRFFDYVLCADKLKTIKPNPEIILNILHRFKVTKKDTLYVGDMAIDIQAGRRAGVDTVAVLTGSHTRSQLKKQRPTRILSSARELCYIVATMSYAIVCSKINLLYKLIFIMLCQLNTDMITQIKFRLHR